MLEFPRGLTAGRVLPLRRVQHERFRIVAQLRGLQAAGVRRLCWRFGVLLEGHREEPQGP